MYIYLGIVEKTHFFAIWYESSGILHIFKSSGFKGGLKRILKINLNSFNSIKRFRHFLYEQGFVDKIVSKLIEITQNFFKKMKVIELKKKELFDNLLSSVEFSKLAIQFLRKELIQFIGNYIQLIGRFDRSIKKNMLHDLENIVFRFRREFGEDWEFSREIKSLYDIFEEIETTLEHHYINLKEIVSKFIEKVIA